MGRSSQRNAANSAILNNGLRSDNPYSFDNFRNSFGSDYFDEFVTGDLGWKRMFELSNTALDWQAQRDMLDYQNEYNSPIAKAQRERSAGLNPDLIGLDAASDSAEVPSAAVGEPSVRSSSEIFQTYMSAVSTAFESAMSLLGEFQSMRGISLDNDSKTIANAQSLRNLVSGSISSYLYYDPVSNSFIDNPRSMPSDFGFRPNSKIYKQAKSMQSALTTFAPNSPADNPVFLGSVPYETAKYKAKTDITSLQKTFGHDRGSYGFSFDDQTYIDVLTKISDAYAELEQAKTKYDIDYYHSKDGSVIGANEEVISNNERAISNSNRVISSANASASENQKNIESAWREVISNLTKESKKDGREGTIAKIALILLRFGQAKSGIGL